MTTNSYQSLIVWQKAMELVKEVYNISHKLPAHELYILASQMLRAAISIPSNIAEGYRRNYKLEFIRFLSIALASASELQTQLLICKEQYVNIDYQTAETLLGEVHKMLYSLIKKLKIN